MFRPGRAFPGAFVGDGVPAKRSGEIRRIPHQFFGSLLSQLTSHGFNDKITYGDLSKSRQNGDLMLEFGFYVHA